MCMKASSFLLRYLASCFANSVPDEPKKRKTRGHCLSIQPFSFLLTAVQKDTESKNKIITTQGDYCTLINPIVKSYMRVIQKVKAIFKLRGNWDRQELVHCAVLTVPVDVFSHLQNSALPSVDWQQGGRKHGRPFPRLHY